MHPYRHDALPQFIGDFAARALERDVLQWLIGGHDMSAATPVVEVITAENPLRDAARAAADAITMADRATGAARLAVSGQLRDGFLLMLRLRLAGEEGNEWDASPGNVWPRLKLTWIDEYCVPMADVRSARGTVARSGVLEGKYKLGYELPLFCDGEDQASAADRVTRQFAEQFAGGLDVAVVDLDTMLTLAPASAPGAVVQPVKGRDGSDALALSAEIIANAPLLVVVTEGRSANEALRLLRARSAQVRLRDPGAIYVVSDTMPAASAEGVPSSR